MTLIQVIKAKTSIWICSGSSKDFSSRKLLSFKLTNEELSTITKKSSSQSGVKSFYKIGNFLEVNAKNFVNLLKQFSGLSLD